MKKVFLFAALAAFAVPAFAGIDQGVDAGMTHISVLGGFAGTVGTYDIQPALGDSDLEYGDAGPSYGLQIMHYIAPHFGLGAEFVGTNYQEAEYTVSSGSAQDKYTTSATRYAVMLSGKFIFSPEAKTRLYIPVGGGFSRFKGTVKGDGNLALSGYSEEENTCTKPAFYAGLGVETDLNDIFIFGLESRYNGFLVDKNKFYNTDYLDDISLLVKIGIKF